MLHISNNLSIPLDEIDLIAIRSQGAGGQNVNKVATAIHLRFDIMASSSLPDHYKNRLMELRDRRISSEGIIVIKSQSHRSQERNRAEALARLRALILSVAIVILPRKLTKPSKGQVRRRLEDKKHRSQMKALRKIVE